MADDTADARITALEASIAELREELRRSREPRDRSMRQTHCCPMCGGNRILHFRQVHETAPQGLIAFSLQKVFTLWRLKRTGGAVEAFACRNCRLIEWHAITLEDVRSHGGDVVELVGDAETVPPARAPYR